ncbi:MAG: 23S rRNA (adenine(2503)-C(2))-methyltransferase RlmN, partial [Candidatus Cloacimonas sp.]
DLAENIISLQPDIPVYRTKQILSWLYKSLINDPDAMTNLPQQIKLLLKDNYSFFLPEVDAMVVSKDRSIKYRLRLEDGELIESVLIPAAKKNTLCISTQVGCAHNCQFCSTGKMGFIRNLQSYEIVGQVINAASYLKNNGSSHLTNLVFMGMGEPMDNLENVLDALKMLQSNEGLSISPRHITISTCGVVPGIISLANSGIKVKLALSLNSAIESKRKELMPICKQYNLLELKQALLYYQRNSTYRVTIEYILFAGYNMGNEDLAALRKYIGDISCKINFIPFNVDGKSKFRAPTEAEITDFMQRAQILPQAITLRKSRGSDILGACGQLANSNQGD